MRIIKNWLYNKFLPQVTKELYMDDLNSVIEANKELKEENKRLKLYIQGMEFAIRRGSKIVITNEVNNGAQD